MFHHNHHFNVSVSLPPFFARVIGVKLAVRHEITRLTIDVILFVYHATVPSVPKIHTTRSSAVTVSACFMASLVPTITNCYLRQVPKFYGAPFVLQFTFV